MGDLIARKVASPPKLDGNADEEAWKNATEYIIGIDLPNKMLKPGDKMKVRVAHDGEHIYMLLQWMDTTHSTKHKPYKWSEIREKYVVDHELEDVAFVAFEMEGRFNVNMVAGVMIALFYSFTET